MCVDIRQAGVLAIGLMAAAACGAEEWARFRGPNGSGVSSDTGFPAEFSPTRNLVWRTGVRPGKSSPVLTARHVFLVGVQDGMLFTQCLDRKTGKLLWERAEPRPRQEVGNTLNEPAALTPVTDGENIYVFFADFGLISYDAKGKLRWKAPLGPFTNTMGLGASPILAGQSVVVVADQMEESFIAAFNSRNGEMQWKSSRAEQDGWATPILYRRPDGDLQILTASRSQLGSHRQTDGARLWSHDRLSPAIVASPVLADDTVFVFGYGIDAAAPFSKILARLDKNQDGALSPDEYGTNALIIGIGRFDGNRDRIVTQDEWDAKQLTMLAPSSLSAVKVGGDGPRELWRYEKNFMGVVPSPLHYQGLVYVIRNGGILTSFDAANGQVLKAARVAGALGGYSASPVAAEGRIFLASEEGKITVLRAGRDWEVVATNNIGEPCFATPALSQGAIYVRTAEACYRFEQAQSGN